MEQPKLDYKMLYVVTSEKNKKYNILHDLLKNEKLVNKLKEKNINVMEAVDDDNDKFTIALYGCDTSLITSYNDISETIINEIIDLADKVDNYNKEKQKGGNVDYMYKYVKYKSKYLRSKQG
jgi:hypothetical protein